MSPGQLLAKHGPDYELRYVTAIWVSLAETMENGGKDVDFNMTLDNFDNKTNAWKKKGPKS